MTWEDYQAEKAALTAEELRTEVKTESPATLGVKQWNMAHILMRKKEAAEREAKEAGLEKNLPTGCIVEYERNEKRLDPKDEKEEIEYEVYRVLKPVTFEDPNGAEK
jgi:hypothetical protein